MTKEAKTGIRAAAELLGSLDRETRERILGEVARQDPRMEESLRGQMFVFDDLVKVDDRVLGAFLRQVPRARLALALRNASEEVRAAVFRNLSAKGGELLRDEMETQGKQRLPDVEAAQAEILRALVERHGEDVL